MPSKIQYTKAELKDYIHAMEERQKSQLVRKKRDLESTIKSEIQELVETFDFSVFDQCNQLFSKVFELRALQKSGDMLYDYTVNRMVNDLPSRGTAISNITASIFRDISDAVEKDRPEGYFKHPGTSKLFAKYKQQYADVLQNLSDLNQLSGQLIEIIRVQRKGTDAFKALVALGVDMRGVEKAKTTVLTVTQLSVDVCKINGNCENESEEPA